MNEILSNYEKYIQSEELDYQWSDDKESILLDYTGRNGTYRIIASELTRLNVFLIYTSCPVLVPDDKINEISEFINRANFKRLTGKFEFDFDNGKILYCAALDFENITSYDNNIFKGLFIASIAAMDKYLPGILGVLFGNKKPKDAIEEIENRKKKVVNNFSLN